MKRMILLGTCLMLPLFCCFGEDQEPINSSPIPVQVGTKEVNIKIDPLSEEQQQLGLTTELLHEALVNQLDTANISVNEGLTHPYLVLRVRTIKVGLDMATFFQLSFHEEAMLARNRAMFHASTWSQASLLACQPEQLKKEVLETVTILAQAFAKEYVKALQSSHT